MRSVSEMSRLTGVSVRTLHYYDRIGLLRPAEVTEAGYRLYGDGELERLQQILLFRELEFPLREIAAILGSAGFDRAKALDQQIGLLTLKKERLEDLIAHARRVREKGEGIMDFSAFDTKKLDEYAERAKAQWGNTDAWKESEKRMKGLGAAEKQALSGQMMEIFAEFGRLRSGSPAAPAAQQLVARLQGFITAHYYTCTPQILAGLGGMYGAGGEFTENIDRAGGAGTAAFASAAIAEFCGKQA